MKYFCHRQIPTYYYLACTLLKLCLHILLKQVLFTKLVLISINTHLSKKSRTNIKSINVSLPKSHLRFNHVYILKINFKSNQLYFMNIR